MKKTYIKPIVKSYNVRLESHIATLSGGGNDTAKGTLNSSYTGNGGEEDVLGKEDFDW